jgi:hypothetical protein
MGDHEEHEGHEEDRRPAMSLRGAQRRSNLNSRHGRLLRFARNDISLALISGCLIFVFFVSFVVCISRSIICGLSASRIGAVAVSHGPIVLERHGGWITGGR